MALNVLQMLSLSRHWVPLKTYFQISHDMSVSEPETAVPDMIIKFNDKEHIRISFNNNLVTLHLHLINDDVRSFTTSNQEQALEALKCVVVGDVLRRINYDTIRKSVQKYKSTEMDHRSGTVEQL